jgi:hypothetical protein
MKQWTAGLAAAALILAAPAAVQAHDGHAHTAMGFVESVSGSRVTVKTTDGKTVVVMLDARTAITRGKTRVQASALKVGDRVVAAGPEDQGMILATTVKLGEAPAATAQR